MCTWLYRYIWMTFRGWCLWDIVSLRWDDSFFFFLTLIADDAGKWVYQGERRLYFHSDVEANQIFVEWFGIHTASYTIIASFSSGREREGAQLKSVILQLSFRSISIASETAYNMKAPENQWQNIIIIKKLLAHTTPCDLISRTRRYCVWSNSDSVYNTVTVFHLYLIIQRVYI